MRRLLLLLALLGLLAVACGGDSDDGGGGGDTADAGDCAVDALDEASGPVELTYWYGGLGAGLGDAMKELIAQYNDSQDKVEVNGQFQGTYDEAIDKYLKSLKGSLPDLVLVEDTQLQLMIDSKSVIPAQACIDADDYDLTDHLDAVLTQMTVDDTLWPVPFNVSNPVLLYDKNDFTKAGLDPEDPPSTFDEVVEAAKKIKASGAAKSGYAWDMEPWNVEEWFSKAGEPIVDNDNGRSDRATESVLDSDTGREIYDFVTELFAEDVAVNVGRNESKADALLAVGKGDAAMTLATTASLGSIYAIQEAGQFADVSVGVAPMYGPNAEDGGVTVGGGTMWIVGKDKSDLKRAAAWDFAKWLNEPEQQAHWHALTGYIPIRKSAIELPEVVDLWKKRPTFRVAYDQLAASKIEQGGPAIGPYKDMRAIIRDSLEQIVLKKVPTDKALADVHEAIKELLASYNERVE